MATLVCLMLLACKTGGPVDDLAMEIDDFHQDISPMVASYSEAESLVSDKLACTWVRELAEESSTLSDTGPEALVRKAGLDLRYACEEFEGAVQDREEWMSEARQNLDPRRIAALKRALNSDEHWTDQAKAGAIQLLTYEDRAWTDRTFYARQRLNASCQWLRAYEMVKGPEPFIKCGTFGW